MEAIRLDIVLNSTEAQAALADYATALIRAGDTATEAAAKVEKFEKTYSNTAARSQAKKALDELTGATNKAGEAAGKAAEKQDGQTRATDALVSAAKRYVAPAAVGAAILKTIEWADNVGDLAERTRISTTQVQQLEKMAQKNGSTFGVMAGLIQAAEQRLAGHNAKAEEAVRLMGLAPERLLAMDPLERLRAIAQGLANTVDPAQRSAFEMAVLGRASDGASPALNALAEGADRAERALGADFVQAGRSAQDVLDSIKNYALDAVRAIVLIGPAIVAQAKQLDELRAKGGGAPSGAVLGSSQGPFFDVLSAQYAAEVAKGNTPGLPGAPGAPFMPSGLPVPGSPMEGAAGQSWGFLNRFFGTAKAPKGGGYAGTPWTSTLGSSAASIFALGNSPALLPFTLPFMSSPGLLQSGGSPISFANGSMLAGTVGMNAPPGASLWSKLSGGKMGAGLGAGLGILSNLIPGLSRTGSSIGATAGSFFGPLGSGIGSLAGGLIGKLFGGNSDKKEINALKGGEDFLAIKAKAEELGISMDKVFSAKKVEDFQKALKGVTDQISAQEGEQQKVIDAMERWGLSVEEMGPKFKQTEMDKTAKSFTEDFMTLVGAGADVNTVIEKMGPSVGAFIQKAIEMGTTVPLEMKPILEKMIEQGKLVDANGEKFTELGQIPFAQDLNKQFSSLIDKLDQLISRVFNLGDAFSDAADKGSQITVPDGGGGDSTVNVSKGGIIAGKGNVLYFKRGGFVPHGTDTVPAMLTPGEMVLARDQVKRLARGGGSQITVNVNVAGYLDSPKVQRDLVRVVTEGIDRDTRMRRVG